MLISGGAGEKLSDKELNIKIIRILDSAIKIEPTYNSAVMNGLSPLIKLKRYKEAIAAVKQQIVIYPHDYNLYIKGGIIYMDYLNKKMEAINFFNTAYKITLIKGKKVVSDDLKIAFALIYFKGKQEAIKYLNRVSANYNDTKSLDQIKVYKQMITNEKFDVKTNFKIFNNFSTI
ncbi:hypothetical protein [Pedobacter mucosus]|uniref:hypothetical protein n=1 Tax=Pedobacter mucosus TaxID=2895286 RepID=UPI001EE4C164|nr:hypothetical protein [Pedobacter mucosus]UKT63964.1 hypothetical protein LOK61_19610 [Pedobacter mucosus]